MLPKTLTLTSVSWHPRRAPCRATSSSPRHKSVRGATCGLACMTLPPSELACVPRGVLRPWRGRGREDRRPPPPRPPRVGCRPRPGSTRNSLCLRRPLRRHLAWDQRRPRRPGRFCLEDGAGNGAASSGRTAGHGPWPTSKQPSRRFGNWTERRGSRS